MTNTHIHDLYFNVKGTKGDFRADWHEDSNGNWKVDWATHAVTPDPDVAPVNTVLPSISAPNGLYVGAALTLTQGTWTGSPTPTLADAWFNDGGEVGTGGTYVLQQSDVGSGIAVHETATNTAGQVTVNSAIVGPVLAAVAPTNTAVPTISGTATHGNTLTAANGTWTGHPTPTFTYQWNRSGTPITGATASTYVVQVADEGSTLTVTVTGTNAGGHSAATSAPTATVN